MIAERMKIINKKGRPTKNQCYENGDQRKQNDKKKQKRRKKKAFEEAQDEVVKQITEGDKKGSRKCESLNREEEELLQFVNSNFGSRAKRKCVLQNEAKSKENWWSDENDDVTDEDEVEEEIVDDDDNDDGITKRNDDEVKSQRQTVSIAKRDVRKRRKGGGGRQSNKQRTKHNETEELPLPTEQTVHCYVFSTGMANRAGHAVNSGTYKTISEYHHEQKWETPYLIPEIHCRPFYPELEKINSAYDSKDHDIAVDSPVNTESVKLDENVKSIDSYPVDIVKKPEIKSEDSENVLSPLHPRNNLPVTLHPSDNKTEDSKPLSEDTKPPSNSPPANEEAQLAPSPPKIMKVETNIKIEENRHKTESNSVAEPTMSQPPPLTSVSQNKMISYPADISKDLFKYQAQSNVKTHMNLSMSDKSPEYKSETHTRPSVLNMAIERKPPTDVRSSIDIAERMLKESRSVHHSVSSTGSHQMPPFNVKTSTVPIFPRDVHPSVFMSMHSPHMRAESSRYRPSSFQTHELKSYPGGDSLFSASLRHKSPFTPPPISHSHHINSSFSSPRHENPYSIYSSRENAHIFARHKTTTSPGLFQNSESKFCEPYKPLSASLKNGAMERPSSLPVPTNRVEKHPPKSFSVESLTKPSASGKHLDNTLSNGLSEKSSRLIERPHFLPEQEHLLREQRHRALPNGMNGLKRSLDERLSNHMRERIHETSHSPFYDSFHDERYLAAAVAAERNRQESDRISTDKDHFLHRSRLPFTSPSVQHSAETTSIMVPPMPSFMKNSRNGGEPFPPNTYSPYLRMGLSFAPPQFSHR